MLVKAKSVLLTIAPSCSRKRSVSLSSPHQPRRGQELDHHQRGGIGRGVQINSASRLVTPADDSCMVTYLLHPLPGEPSSKRAREDSGELPSPVEDPERFIERFNHEMMERFLSHQRRVSGSLAVDEASDQTLGTPES